MDDKSQGAQLNSDEFQQRLRDLAHRNLACTSYLEAPLVANGQALHEAAERIEKLEREIEVLRQYGNKDCTAMADEELAAHQPEQEK